jgi:lipopolysaccharide biosynthesis regulator YciM
MLDSHPVLIVLPFILIAFVLGVFFGNKRTDRPGTTPSNPLSSDYFKGLNYLLNEQTDKAIDVFVRMLDVGDETVDTHISLGNLYRQRGEVDQAIKIHQNVIAKPSLDLHKRNEALYELARDFMHAGLLDRAENLFQELLQKQSYVIPALKNLLKIYQEEKDWDVAIGIAKKLEAASNKSQVQLVAHFYCELALIQHQKGNLKQALELIKKARGSDKQLVRVSIIEGNIEHELGNCKDASCAYLRVEQQDPLMISEILQPLVQCYKDMLNDKELKHYLEHVVTKYGGITSILLYADQIAQLAGEKEAALFIVEALRKKPSLRGLSHLIEISLDLTTGSAHKNLIILQELTSQLLSEKPVYRCNQCGFEGNSLYWQCPSCKSWSSTKPIQGIEGE